ncbi:MAG: cytochrome c3 family protein [Acidobacteria bacterium]|nr:cytochrome c3 family protein [Acidobacteriota bacterium]
MELAPPWKAPWFLGFGFFFAVGWFLFGWVWPAPSPRQPLRYNHAVHIANGMGCVDCHAGGRDQERATLPGLDTCLMCHQEAVTESSEEEKIRAFAAAGREIPWAQATRVPRHVYFSHRRHVALGGLECVDCHGAMETRTEPPRYPVGPTTMDACLDCHEQRKVDNDCNRCHR